jgi:Asp-tRNA(Asn)/Glu-tRNA(Gln) amidotransferase A subunit family amidase
MIRLRYTLPVNLAGFPALTIPVPSPGMPVGLQLIGLPGSEAQLLVLGAAIEAACRR